MQNKHLNAFLAFAVALSVVAAGCDTATAPDGGDSSGTGGDSPSVSAQEQESKPPESSPPESSGVTGETADSVSEVASASGSQGDQSGDESETVIEVEPISPGGKLDSFQIKDAAAQKKILDYLSTMQAIQVDPLDPLLGGRGFGLSITQNGQTKKYDLIDYDEVCRVFLDDQCYTASSDLWETVAEFFPLFSRDNTPRYSIDVMNPAKNRGMSMSYYDEGKAVWSESEQERTTKILGYIKAMTPRDSVETTAAEEKEALKLTVWEYGKDTTDEYTCYNRKDEKGGIVKLGQDQWFSADAGLYDYLMDCFSEIPEQSSAEDAVDTIEIGNPFVLDPAGDYELYAYNAPVVGYANLGYAYWSSQGVSQPALEAAIEAINQLPLLEHGDPPSGSPEYGLMTVAKDGTYNKVQFFLYSDCLTVNDTPYRLNPDLYAKLKKAMADGIASNPTVPHWFAYMNPHRVTGIVCTNENGEMQEMKRDNLYIGASELRYIHVSGVKTYTPGSKNLDGLPFKAVYTFDNGGTYTVAVSDTTPQTNNVTFYVESSDMSFACEYTTSGYISSYVESTQGMIEGLANPRTM